jgi:aminobenzoyl-glutamate utilization protein B
MKYLAPLFLCISTLALSQKSKDEVIKFMDGRASQYGDAAQKIWEFAEVGFQETKSSALLQGILKEAGFQVQSNVAGMPTAFIASYGTGKPVIAILAEFDALPGVSQEALPDVKPIPGKVAGHACGHHLFGVASSAAGIALKNWLASTKTSGTIRVYGTPAEEGG